MHINVGEDGDEEDGLINWWKNLTLWLVTGIWIFLADLHSLVLMEVEQETWTWVVVKELELELVFAEVEIGMV